MLFVYTIFVFLGFGLGSFMPSAMNLIYDFARDGDNKIYMALTDTCLAPFTLLSIIIIGSMSRVINAEPILTGIGIFLVIGILFLIFRVKDPKHYLDNQSIAQIIS
jgi:MFS family permease